MNMALAMDLMNDAARIMGFKMACLNSHDTGKVDSAVLECDNCFRATITQEVDMAVTKQASMEAKGFLSTIKVR